MNAWLAPSTANSGTDLLLALLASASAKAALVLAAGGLVALALAKRSAASRHLAWAVAATSALAIPAVAALMPAWHVALPAAWLAAPESPTSVAAELPAPARFTERQNEEVVIAYAPRASESAREAPLAAAPTGQLALVAAEPAAQTDGSWQPAPVVVPEFDFSWVVPVWALGALLCALPVFLGAVSLRRLVQTAQPVTEGPMLALARRLAAQLGLKRNVRVLQTPLRTIPMTWGVLRPVILLPGDAAKWSEERLATALWHELAHVARFDCLAQLLARMSCAFYWFNPLAWLALAQIRIEQERACDDLALQRGFDRVAYADHLLAILAGRTRRRASTVLALAMAGPARLEGRLRRILDVARCRRGLSRRTVAIACAAAGALVLPLASIAPQAEALALEAAPAALAATTAAEGPADAAADEPAQKDDAPKREEGRKEGAVELEVLTKVREAALNVPDDAKLRAGAIKGILETLHDPYSAYLDEQTLAEFERNTQAKVSGIGVELREKDGEIVVISPLPDSPAHKAGLAPGDVIEEVEGKALKGMSLPEVVKRIVGPVGQPVRMKARHSDGRIVELAITRATVPVPTVRGFRYGEGGHWDYQLDPERGIGYVRISQFSATTHQSLKEALEQLRHSGMKGLVLDLRNCPGGLMGAAVDVVKLFLSKGTIVSVRGRSGEGQSTVAEGNAPYEELPLIVMIDGSTASGAEIVSGSLRYNDRAVAVGSRTFGKGSIQTLLALKEGAGAIKLTSARYELAGGVSIDKEEGKTSWGVDPTDGYYIPVDDIQREAMNKKRLERERLGTPTAAAKITPEWLEGDQADPALASALRAMIARTTKGAFEKTGHPLAEQTARIERMQTAKKRRDALLEDLKKVDQELNELK